MSDPLIDLMFDLNFETEDMITYFKKEADSMDNTQLNILISSLQIFIGQFKEMKEYCIELSS